MAVKRTVSKFITAWCTIGDHAKCVRTFEAHHPGKCTCTCHAINRITKET